MTNLPFDQDYIERYRGETVIVKCGGETLEKPETLENLITQLQTLHACGVRVVLVHGGGGQIKERAEAHGITEQKVNGVRITCASTMEVVEEVLSELNESLTAAFNRETNCALSLPAHAFIVAQQVEGKGLVGEPEHVDLPHLQEVMATGKIVVVHPVCRDAAGRHLNVNADSVAGAVGRALKARRVIFCTGAPGVLDKERTVIPSLSPEMIGELIADGTVTDGMVKKLEECVALLDDVRGVAIVGAADPGSILRELFGPGGGTLIRPQAAPAISPAA